MANKILYLIFGISVILVLLIVFWVVSINKIGNVNDGNLSTAISGDTSSNIDTQSDTTYDFYKWYKDKSMLDGGTKASWKDWNFYFVYGSGDNEVKDAIYLYAENSITHKKREICNSEYDKDCYGEVKVLDDTLLFGPNFQEYMQYVSVYMMHLPLAEYSKPTRIFSSSHGGGWILDGKDGKYWINDGFGDAGLWANNYVFVDTKKTLAGPMIGTFTDCGVGNYSIGNDDNGQMFVVVSEVKDSNVNSDEMCGDASITKIIKIDGLSGAETEVLQKKDLPKDVFDVVYLSNLNKIMLIGNSVYSFDSVSKKSNKLADIPEDIVKNFKLYYAKDYLGKDICFTNGGKELPSYLFDVNKKIFSVSTLCNPSDY